MCRAFGGNKSNIDTFQVVGFANWKKATEKFSEHHKSSVHIYAGLKLKSHQQTLTTEKSSHANQQWTDKESWWEQRISEKKKVRLCSSVVTLVVTTKRMNQKNQGNFLQLMDLRATDNQLINRLFKKRERFFFIMFIASTRISWSI